MIITDKGEIKKLRKPGKVEMSDCRVGVWVLKDEKPYKLTGRDIDACHFTWMNGIELNEKLLIDAGFQLEYDPRKDHRIAWFQKDTVRLEVYSAEIKLVGGSKEVKYQYLHQLQNLYYCLTGTELKINL